MSYESEHLSTAIQKARVQMGLSQRDLSTMSGLSQAQISKFENGMIDLRLSSLVALFRAVELEIELVPRMCLPAVQLIVQGARSQTTIDPKLFSRAQLAFDHVLHGLAKLEQRSKEAEQLREYTNFLSRVRIPAAQTKNFKRWIRHLERLQEMPLNSEEIEKLLKRTKEFEKQIDHTQLNESLPLRPAYSLEDDGYDA